MTNWENHSLGSLVGKVVTAFRFNGAEGIVFVCQGEEMPFRVEGDCCSYCWFFRFRGLANLIGETVEGVVEISTDDVDPDDGLGKQEDDQVYGLGLKTSKGVFEIVFRNSSNGYYGGWIEKGTVGGEFQELTSDWQAK